MAETKRTTNELDFARVILSLRKWWRDDVVATVNQEGIVELRREEADLSSRFLFMTIMSAGIAILGLILSSPAVVIGAMLIAPLMGPIIGLGFAMASGDYVWLRKCAKSVAIGATLAVLFCAVIVFMSPLKTVTAELAARTRPNLFDLLVAIFSGLAGAYALIRGREGAVVGVAIATALMPPLATVGFGLATLNWTVFSGSLMLFITNLVAISLTAAVMARLYGFTTELSAKHTRWQNFLILGTLIALAIPLGLALRTIAWEAQASRQINRIVIDAFDDESRLSQIDIAYDATPVRISATVLTPHLKPDAEAEIERQLEGRLDHEFELVLTQYRVGTSDSAAERAQLAAAREQDQAAEQARQVAAALALVAGVEESDVLVDRQRRRALVRARPLEGATLRAYRTLEQRAAAQVKGWAIELVPPARPLPSVAFEEEAPSEDGEDAIALAAWASARVGAPLVLTGPDEQTALVSEQLKAAGGRVTRATSGPAPVRIEWGSVEE
ncbi:TIGR00341 family protein [Altererythrobacter sp. H2]|uniref:TIGR00341 family protein n=1 Tax=Altererythrobacter sp. H2 TaxID=3108391 RepID=UPI002B4BE4B2|nr:TIGR00341 family protein [Altererythrobacter sp. H2]WRK96580.1 TIGR00341 family protein [Altererythrobacter sp. H2]